MTIDKTLEERGERYGEFRHNAEIAQDLKDVLRRTESWADLPYDICEALEMIQHKIARILNGAPEYVDSWTDIIGYARLVEKRLIDDQRSALKMTITEQLEAQVRALRKKEASESCTDPRCPEHNASIQDALEVLIKAGVVSPVK